jgi:hypothetical protein
MSIHVCKQCGSRFEYCRACVFRPIRYKDKGFCSKECYEASKNVTVKPEPIVEEVITVEIEEPIVEINNEPSIEEVQPIEEEIAVEVLDNAETTTEATTVAEPTIKEETYNTYKKKKNKYKVHE